MLIAARNAMMAGKSILPPGARWVEYLESTGTQWIDTGYLPNNMSGVMIVASSDTTRAENNVFGVRQDSGNTRFNIKFGPSLIQINWGTYIELSSGRYTANVVYTITDNYLNSRVGTLNGSTIQTDYSVVLPQFTRSALICAYNLYGSVIELFQGGVYVVKISEGNVLVRDFRPIAIGSTGYMLDLLTGDYLPYGNKGTGAFIIGPDISAPAV